ncbi:MAG: hypothetical protein JWM74_5234 [Myxococcaceae bacterium]|jgi:hypothetical protein|nr:hypothetical protein [Myxococcaceae bacterium]
MTALFSRMFQVLVTAGAICGAVAISGCAMPVGSDDEGVSSNRLTGGDEEAQIGANPDSSGDSDGRPANPGTNRMVDNGPGHEPDPSPWANDVLKVGVVVSPPAGSPAEEPDPSPWMHKVDTASR